MTFNQNPPRFVRCWRLLTSCVPERLRARLRGPLLAALKHLSRRAHNTWQGEVNLQLDAILRELRRLQMRMEELEEAQERRQRAA